MEVKLGGWWSRCQMRKMFQGQWVQILTDSRMEVKLGRWPIRNVEGELGP